LIQHGIALEIIAKSFGLSIQKIKEIIKNLKNPPINIAITIADPTQITPIDMLGCKMIFTEEKHQNYPETSILFGVKLHL
jgi:hypothetical protein